MAKKNKRRKRAKSWLKRANGRKNGSSGAFQQDFLDSLFGGGGSFPLALPMKPLIPIPPKNIFPPDFFAGAAHFGGVPPFPFDFMKLGAYGSGGGGGRIPPPPPHEGGGTADEGAGEHAGGDNENEEVKEAKGSNKRLEKILRLLNLITKGRAKFFTDATQIAVGGGGVGDIPGAEMLAKFAPAIASFVAAVKVFEIAAEDRQERGSVEQRAAALGMDARKAFSADVTMKAFGGNFESIAKPMVAWADAMTGVQMGDAGKFSNIMKQVAELSGMGYNIDLRHGSGKFGMASNEEFFTRMTDALSQALQKGDIGAQQKIQSIAGFDSSIADILTSVKGTKGSDVLKYAFSREDSMAARTKAGSRYGRRAASAGWDSLKDTAGAIGSAALDVLTGPVITEALEPMLNTNEARVNEHRGVVTAGENLPKKAKGGRETRPAIFAEAGPEWFIPEKNDENSRALLISAAQACGFDMFAKGGKSSSGKARTRLGFKGPNNDWRLKRRGLIGGSRTTADSLGFRGPTHDWRVNNRTFYGDGTRMSERLGFKGPSPVNHTNTVTMNISKVEVSANNAKEFAESMLKARQNPLSNVAKSIASSVDTKRIA